MRRRIKNSLTAKIFMLTSALLLFISGITYACVAGFLPSTYQNALEEDLQRVSEELRQELERYGSIDEAENLLLLFEANNQASVNILNEEGELVFPVSVAYTEGVFIGEKSMTNAQVETIYDNWNEEYIQMDDVCEQSYEEAEVENQAEEQPPEIGSEEEMEEEIQTINGVTMNSYQEMPEFEMNALNSAIQSYQIKIGGKNYTMLVTGTMQAVSQAMEILRDIFPMILGIIAAAALICAFVASFYLIRPIVRLSRVSKKMASLQFEEECHENRTDEIGILSRSLNELSENLSVALGELKEANRKLKSDMEREREEERKRTAFFAAASHELKTPVTVLKGHLGGMIKNIGAYSDRDCYLKRSYQVTETMEGMVKEILAVSRMESGAWEITPRQVDLAELVRLQAAEFFELLEGKNMKLSVEMPAHAYCEADSSMMVKVFRNFFINAIRYSPPGARIRVFMKEEKEELFFFMENSDVFIPEESIGRLFDAFYRVDNSRNRQLGGSGLGLYIVRMILEQHGAVYGAGNTAKGVRFWFRLSK